MAKNKYIKLYQLVIIGENIKKLIYTYNNKDKRSEKMKVDGKIKLYEAERFRDLREMITSSVKKYKDKVAFVIKHKKASSILTTQ